MTDLAVDLESGYSARTLTMFDSVRADRAELYYELPLIRAVTDPAAGLSVHA